MTYLGGFVTSPKMFIGSNHIIDEEGLLSQKIFGPIESYKCQCGKLKLNMDKGQICKVCNVISANKNLRVKTSGRIKLLFPVVKPNKIKYITDLFTSKVSPILDPIVSDTNLSVERYISISPSGEKVDIVTEITHRTQYILPLRITGIYSFILGIKYLINNFIDQLPIVEKLQKLFDDKIIVYELKVLPPDIRPVFVDREKVNTVRVTEVNKHYTSILNLNKSNQLIQANIPADEELWLGMIDVNFRSQNQEQIIEYGIMEYDQITSRYQYYTNLIYRSIFDIISKKEGFIRSLILSKTIDFSARTVIRSDISIKPYQISVSRRILYKLWKLQFIYFLTKIKGLAYDNAFENFVTKKYDEVKEDFNEFIDWYMGNGKESTKQKGIEKNG